ncbi:hypothetical protein [Caldovatus aquaticus]|uniref:2-keto-4-pentenoate hydratase n=1 Tax=Caldovatus aquaticus TaxID=2865671 RepID=A0ABS7F311_9PROT|nr:hypothetical protein [Caldovatus aquaticus]MBW8269884.1 hypothetical protein [Caldovatus aquaticus]
MPDRRARAPAAPFQPSARAAAGWIAEALVTGNPLAPLPEDLAPRTTAEGECVALAVLEEAGLVACGVRVAPGPAGGPPVAGPVIESRLLRDGATIALSALRHPAVSAAVVGVLGRALPPGEEEQEPSVFSALHPAVDIAASRFRDPPQTPALQAADLGGLGLLVVGRGVAPAAAGPVPVRLGPAGARRRRGEAPVPLDLLAALAPAVAAARRLGGLPAGAVLVAAGLAAPAIRPSPEGVLRADFGPLGRVQARFTAG